MKIYLMQKRLTCVSGGRLCHQVPPPQDLRVVLQVSEDVPRVAHQLKPRSEVVLVQVVHESIQLSKVIYRRNGCRLSSYFQLQTVIHVGEKVNKVFHLVL